MDAWRSMRVRDRYGIRRCERCAATVTYPFCSGLKNINRYSPLAVGLMKIEHLRRYAPLAVGLKPSAMQGEARLRGLYRI